jgi:hypothetical protein
MTMARAIILLFLASGLLVGSVLLFIWEHGEGFEFTTRTGGPGTGARTGPNAVVEPGGTLSPGAADATARAVIATVTALAGGGGSVATTPVPSAFEPVGIGETVEYGGSRYTVLQVQDPEPEGFFRAEPGKRRVALEIRQEATGRAGAYSFALFSLRDTAGGSHTWTIANNEPAFGSGSLAPGEAVTGWVTFQVTEGAEVAELVVLAGTQRVVLVKLR